MKGDTSPGVKKLKMYNFLILFLKGIAMGIANIIPGVSGGTIALITNIYEDFINSLKSFDHLALKMLFNKEFEKFYNHTNLKFLTPVIIGLISSIFGVAKTFEILFNKFPTQIWAFFFGLVLASIYYIAKDIKKWNTRIFLSLFFGILIAFSMSYINPNPTENTNFIFILFCGIIGICGMILPGLSGSYILMLMGNYELLMVKCISYLFDTIKLFISGKWELLFTNEITNIHLIYLCLFIFGSILGIIIFSHIISWVFKNFRNITLAILTGFVFGSLNIIWPWKNKIFHQTLKDRNGDLIILGYENYFPKNFDSSEFWSLLFLIIGFISIIVIEILAKNHKK